jgi:hypothetical protein
MEQYSTEEIKNQLQTLAKNANTNLKEIISSIQDQTYQQKKNLKMIKTNSVYLIFMLLILTPIRNVLKK